MATLIEHQGLSHFDYAWMAMLILDPWQERATWQANRIAAGKQQYEAVTQLCTDKHGVSPHWAFIGILHMMEGCCDFNLQIGNGERWDKQTTIVPAGKGPFASWPESALYFIEYQGLHKRLDWISISRLLYRFEEWNGWGYALRDKESPYLWSGSNIGERCGKFICDGPDGYDADAVSEQVGAAVLLRRMIKMGIVQTVGDQWEVLA